MTSLRVVSGSVRNSTSAGSSGRPFTSGVPRRAGNKHPVSSSGTARNGDNLFIVSISPKSKLPESWPIRPAFGRQRWVAADSWKRSVAYRLLTCNASLSLLWRWLWRGVPVLFRIAGITFRCPFCLGRTASRRRGFFARRASRREVSSGARRFRGVDGRDWFSRRCRRQGWKGRCVCLRG